MTALSGSQPPNRRVGGAILRAHRIPATLLGICTIAPSGPTHRGNGTSTARGGRSFERTTRGGGAAATLAKRTSTDPPPRAQRSVPVELWSHFGSSGVHHGASNNEHATGVSARAYALRCVFVHPEETRRRLYERCARTASAKALHNYMVLGIALDLLRRRIALFLAGRCQIGVQPPHPSENQFRLASPRSSDKVDRYASSIHLWLS
jgi:hypothetical protein